MGNVRDAMNRHEQERDKDSDATGRPESPVARSDAGASEPARQAQSRPVVTDSGYSPSLVTHHDRGGLTTEQYRSLRTNLLARSGKQSLCLIITSSEVGEGKSVTSANLALVLAESPDYRTVIVGGDLRRPKVGSLLQIERTPGFAELLSGAVSLDEATHPTVYPNLDVIPAGRARPDEVGKLLSTPRTREITSELKRRYDCVLIDTPPVTNASDAGMLGRAIGEALFVIRMNKTSRESVNRAMGLLRAADVKVTGLVLTHQKDYVPRYLTRYSRYMYRYS